jgi:hypothetical protein
VIKGTDNQVDTEMFKVKGFYFYVMILSSKWQKPGEGIPVGFNSVLAAALHAGKVLIKKLMQTG